jgi:hypothetical protein
MYFWLLKKLGSPVRAALVSVLVYGVLALGIAICSDLPDHSLRYLEI